VSVHRIKPLPKAAAKGRLVVGESVATCTLEILRASGANSPSHEGLAWWLGRIVGDDVLVLACHRPQCASGPQFVMAEASATGAASRAARAVGLAIVAQVHSHPGHDTRHSDGDDDLVLMPYEGMFSLVVADYGSGSLLPEEGAGLHQFQKGKWVQIDQPSPALVVAPTQVVG
jgi:proteasome lid subunit RPN8/RPN11